MGVGHGGWVAGAMGAIHGGVGSSACGGGRAEWRCDAYDEFHDNEMKRVRVA